MEHKFVSKDLQTGTSPAARKYMDSVYEKVQVRNETDHQLKTLHPSGGEPLTYNMEIRPIKVKLPTEEEAKTYALVIASATDLEHSRRDESERSKTFDNARRSYELLRHIDDISILFSLEGKTVFMSVAAEEFYVGSGRVCSKDEMNLKAVFESIMWNTPQQEVDVRKRVSDLRPGDEVLEWEVRKRKFCPDPTVPCKEMWYIIRFRAVCDPVSGLNCILVVEQNISNLKRSQDLQKAQEEFFAAVSHELRTPLNGIIGLSDSLLRMCESSNLNAQSFAKTLKVIMSSGNRLASLVNDILDAASLRKQTLVMRQEVKQPILCSPALVPVARRSPPDP